MYNNAFDKIFDWQCWIITNAQIKLADKCAKRANKCARKRSGGKYTCYTFVTFLHTSHNSGTYQIFLYFLLPEAVVVDDFPPPPRPPVETESSSSSFPGWEGSDDWLCLPSPPQRIIFSLLFLRKKLLPFCGLSLPPRQFHRRRRFKLVGRRKEKLFIFQFRPSSPFDYSTLLLWKARGRGAAGKKTPSSPPHFCLLTHTHTPRHAHRRFCPSETNKRRLLFLFFSLASGKLGGVCGGKES